MLSLEYESEAESNIGLVLLAQEQSLPTLPPLIPISQSPLLLLPYEAISQHNLNMIIRQQQEQLVVMQVQIQALLAGEAVARGSGEGGTEVAKPQIFNRTLLKVSRFITVYRLYLRMKMREVSVEKQIQWILSYVQEGAANIWKENVLEDLEAGKIEYELAGEFLAEIKKEFGGGEKELMKIAELKRIEQEERVMEKFV